MVDAPMDHRDPDTALMVAYQQGDDSSFDQLLDKYHKPIVDFIYKIVNNAGEAEELAQEVFLRIHRVRRAYKPRARFAAWIYRIATNVSLKAAGRNRRMRFWSRNHNSQKDFPPAEETLPDPAPDAERQLVAAEMGRVIRSAIQTLPLNERVAIVLRRYQELSYKEIAEIMECTESAVKTYIHRGKLHVRDRIMPYLEKGRI